MVSVRQRSSRSDFEAVVFVPAPTREVPREVEVVIESARRRHGQADVITMTSRAGDGVDAGLLARGTQLGAGPLTNATLAFSAMQVERGARPRAHVGGAPRGGPKCAWGAASQWWAPPSVSAISGDGLLPHFRLMSRPRRAFSTPPEREEWTQAILAGKMDGQDCWHPCQGPPKQRSRTHLRESREATRSRLAGITGFGAVLVCLPPLPDLDSACGL